MRYILPFFLFLFTSALVSCQSSNDYETFKSLFPDFFSESFNSKDSLLPVTDFTRESLGRGTEYSPEDIEAGALDNMYVVGKIENYQGLDLFILDYEYSRPDEDTYDNHGGITQFMLVFKDGKLMLNENADDIEETWIPLDQFYYGEGGEADYSSTIQKDTTITTRSYHSLSESATGFQTPLNILKEFRWHIGKNGKQEILYYDRIEISSPFFSTSFPVENNLQPSELSSRFYPITNDNGLWCEIEPSPLSSGNDCAVSFHYEYMEAGYRGVLTLLEEGKVRDMYIIGEPSDKNTQRDYPGLNPKLKCPVIIQTSDGMVEVSPDGYLDLVTPEAAMRKWPEWNRK